MNTRTVTLLARTALTLALAACGAPVDAQGTESALRGSSAQSAGTERHGADDGGGQACGPSVTCPAGQECDDGRCKPHGGRGGDGASDDGAGTERHGADDGGGQACGPSVTCPAGQECDDGRCKPHGGRR